MDMFHVYLALSLFKYTKIPPHNTADVTMKKLALELLFRITGIGAASGLIYNNGTLLLVSDNSHIVYEYNIEKQHLEKTELVNKNYRGPRKRIQRRKA
jgi:uncharacterized protein YjiK